MDTFNSARWVALSQVGRVAMQLCSLALLARLLPPADYGLMAMATVVTNFALLLRDLGTTAAIIQRMDLREETKATVFWLNNLMGWCLAFALIVFSPVIARYFSSAKLVPVLLALAILFPLASAGAVHQALLERQSAFRVLARIELGSSGLGLAAAMVAALSGAGVYSLVIQAVLTTGLSCAQLWLASGWHPRSRPVWSEIKGLIGFSGNLTAFNFINYFSRNADGMIIGRYLGVTALGAYSMAYKLMLFPVQNLSWVAAKALYPVMSKHQNDTAKILKLYLRAIRLIALFTAPLMAGLVAVREPFVRIAFGPNWGMVPEILAWMAPIGFIQSIVSTSGTIFMARGRTDIMVWLGMFYATLAIAAFVVGSQYGVVGVAALFCVANIINAIPCMVTTMRILESSLNKLLEAIAVPVVGALLMWGALTAMQLIFPSAFAQGNLGFLMSVGFGVLSYGFIIVFIFRQDLSDVRTLVRLSP